MNLNYKKIQRLGKKTQFSNIATVESGKRPTKIEQIQNIVSNIPVYGASGIMGYTSNFIYNKKIQIIGRVGTHGIVQPINGKSYPSDNTLIIISNYYSYTFNVLSNANYAELNKGSTQPLITQTDIKKMTIKIPDIKLLEEFENKYDFDFVFNLERKILSLKNIKKQLLNKYF